MKAGRPLRAVPEGFADIAATTPNKALCQQFGASIESIRRWRKETGTELTTRLPNLEQAPADFAKVAKGKSVAQMKVRYNRGHKTIKRWFAEAGIPCGVEVAKKLAMRPMPDDFPVLSKIMSMENLMLHYGAGRDTVRRWAKEDGQSRPGGFHTVRKEKAKPFVRKDPPKRPARVATRTGANPPSVNAFQRDMSAVGQAAEYLGKVSSIFRCNERRHLDPKGKFWNRGGYLLTDADVLERAAYLREKRATL